MSLRPVFVLSLPRSGSTLVQRVLARHEAIATTPEPWLLLPQVYAMRERGIGAEYGQLPASRALREFASRLPRGQASYDAELRRFVLALYEAAAGDGATYFLDKTPRYHYVIDDLFRVFPDARFVFLWRHPLAVAASIVETWGRGRWKIERWRGDLYAGLANLVDGYRAHEAESLAVRYEDLITDPASSWPRIFAHLALPYDEGLLESFGEVDLRARMGDRTGPGAYDSISEEPLTKWAATVTNPYRKRWLRAYLEWIGHERATVMGYSLDSMLRELDATPTGSRLLLSDVVRGTFWKVERIRREAAIRRVERPPPRSAGR